MSIIDRARQLRVTIENLAVNLTDEQALDNTELFGKWAANTAYTTGDRVMFEGILYKCLQDHTSESTWTPTGAPSLWAKVLNPDPEVIPVWEQPDSTNGYNSGDKVYYPTANDDIYISLIDNNVWSPEAYPDGWARVSPEVDIETEPTEGTETGGENEPTTEPETNSTEEDTTPVWEQPTSANPYKTGDRVHYPTASDPIYESTIDNNVWNPVSYPAGWTLVE